MRQPWIGVGAWLVAIGLVLAGGRSSSDDRIRGKRWPTREILAILLLTGLAFGLRAWQMDQIPWLLTGDEGSFGLGAAEIVSGEKNNIFGSDILSWTRLYFVFPAITIRLFGHTISALRSTSALVGALSVLALYWYVRNAYDRITAFFAAAYLTTFHYHIHFSRLALNNVWDGLFVVLVSGALWRAWQSKSNTTFLITGLLLGISQYFYSTSRILLVAIPAWLVIAFLRDRASVRSRLPGIVLLSLAALVLLLPLVGYFAQQPSELSAPINRFSILGPWMQAEVIRTGESVIQIIGRQVLLAAQGFTYINIRSWYDPDTPMLLGLPSTLFLLGLFMLLSDLKRMPAVWISLWLISALATVGLSDSPPSAQRFIHVAPAVAIVVALPLSRSAAWLGKNWPRQRRIIVAAITGLLIVAMVRDAFFYFGEFTPSGRFSDRNTEVATRAGQYLSKFEDGHDAYFFGPPRMGYYSHSSLPFLAPQVDGEDVVDPLTAAPDWELQGPTSFIFLPERTDELEYVKLIAPNGETIEFESVTGEPLFVVYELYEFGSD